MADRKQLPDLPEATDVSPDDLFLKRDTGETTDQHAGAQLVADKLLGMGQVESSTGQQTVGEALDQRVIYVDTVADLQALDTSGMVDGQQASVGEAGIFVWSGSEWLPKNNETITVRIPSDYPTLQEAIDTLSNFKTAQGVIIDILIESGHSPSQGVKVSDGGYGHFYIKSEDPEVIISQSWGDDDHFLEASQAIAPTLSTVIDMDGRGSRGYYLIRGSSGRVVSGSGIKNAGRTGIYLSDCCSCVANGAISKNCNTNVWVSRSSIFSGENGDFSGGISNAVNIRRCSTATLFGADLSGYQGSEYALSVRRSEVYCGGANITGSSSGAIGAFEASVIRGAQRTGQITDCSGASGNSVFSDRGSIIDLQGADISNSSGRAVLITSGSFINLENADLTECGTTAVEVEFSSTANMKNANVSGAGGRGVRAVSSSRVCFREGNASNCTNHGVEAREGSQIDASNSVINDVGWTAVSCFSGSNINFQDGTSSGSGDANDIRVLNGGVVNANGSSGSLSQDSNQITSDGIIFK